MTHIHCTEQENILTITFNRQAKKNAITREMYQDLTRVLQEADANPNTHVIIITGSDDCFTSGNDLSDFINAKEMKDLEAVIDFLNLLPTLKKPLIAAVNGLAIGIGTTLLLHCDMVFADQQSIFQLPFINLGACPEAGSSLLLPRLVGHQKASELLLLGERFDANMAFRLNLINEITPMRSALPQAMIKAKLIAKKSTHAVQMTKALLKKPIMEQMQATIGVEARSFFECLQTKEAQVALRAFFNP